MKKFLEFLKFNRSRKLSLKQKLHFSKQLSFLIGANLPLLDSILLLQKQADSRLKQIINEIIEKVSRGNSLGATIESLNVFDRYSVQMIRMGEHTGTMSESFRHIHDEMARKSEIQKKLKTALIYPFLIALVTLALVIFITVYIFPKIVPLLAGFNAKIPITTKMILVISGALKKYGTDLLVATIIVFACAVALFKKSQKFKYFMHLKFLKMPLLGKFFIHAESANFCRVLGTLVKCGIPIGNALSITADAAWNVHLKQKIKDVSKNVIEGKKISSEVHKIGIFDQITVSMISVGEKTSNLPAALLYLADFHKAEMETQSKNFSNAVEPILMIISGLVVGFLAVSIISPMYEVTHNLGK